MPKINDYSTPQVSAQANAFDSPAGLRQGGEMGRAIQRFGETFNDVGDMVYRRKAQEETSSLGAKFAEAKAEWAQRLDEETRNQTIDAGKVQEKYKEFISKMDTDIETYEGRRYFDEQAASLGGFVTKNAVRGQAMVAGEKSAADFQNSVNTFSNMLQRRPGDFQSNIDDTFQNLEARISSGAISPAQAEKLKAWAGAELAQNAIRGQTRLNPGRARNELDSGVYDKYLKPDEKAALYNHIDAELRANQNQAEKILELKEKDGWEYLKKVGDVGGLKPISMGPDAGESFTARAEFIESKNKKHGIDLPFLSDLETMQVVNSVMRANPEQAVAAFSNVDSKVEDRYKGKFAREVFKKEPGLAAALMISADSPSDARTIVGGLSLLKNGGDGAGRAIKPPQEAEIARQYDEYTGNAISDPTARQTSRKAILAHLVKTKFDNGDVDFENISNDDFKKSAEAVMGPVVEVGGRKAMSFRGKSGKFIDADDFEDLVDGLTDDQVMAAQGDVPRTTTGEPVNLKKSQGRLSLESVGDGTYRVIRDGKEYLLPKNYQQTGRPFLLDLKKIEKMQPKKKGFFSRVFGSEGKE